MNNQKEPAFKRFSSQSMLNNINHVKNIIQRIRQKEGGIGSDEDELSLHRTIQDLDLLVEIVDGLRTAYDNLNTNFVNLEKQHNGLRSTYEKMLQARNERIKELEGKKGIEPEGESEA